LTNFFTRGGRKEKKEKENEERIRTPSQDYSNYLTYID
jgi:hypothetical protein